MSDPRHIRIFLSSPGDVNDERALTRKVISELHLEPLLRGKANLEYVAWDDPGARTPMLATLTPQEAINRGLPKPSECHIVIVIFWSRMGTLLPDEYRKPDGSRYLSGTEWEYLDAIDSASKHPQELPLVYIYRRTEEPMFSPKSPDYRERGEQYQLVEKFFEQFKNPDGSLRGSINQYASPAEYQGFIENDLKKMILQVLERPDVAPSAKPPPAIETPPSIWQGSPFPGLRAFTADDEPIFFGRGRETDALVSRVKDNRFVGVVGASGSGKSSLVGAGLIPRLRGNAIDGSKDWLILQFTPGEVGDDPFMALAVQLATALKDRPRDIAEALKKSPDALAEYGERALSGKPDWAEIFIFIDQFEELFTLVRPEFQAGFIEMLTAAGNNPSPNPSPLRFARREGLKDDSSPGVDTKIRIVVTMRSDFYHRCVDHPALTDLLERSTYPLSVPKPSSLSQMITRPAERAGLQFEHGLPERILDDTGSDPGALALMAYLLDEMYRISTPSPPAPLPPGARGEIQGEGRLTFEIYDSLGGVQGAIGKRAETTFEKLDDAAQAQLKNVFRELVEVDEHGTATRRRSPYSKVAQNDAARKLVDAFIEARLLVSDDPVRATTRAQYIAPLQEHTTLEVAHEALLRSWPTLVEWIKDAAGDLYALRQARQAAEEWDRKGRPEFLLWRHEQLQPVYDALENLESTAEAPLDAFIRPEAERLLDEFKATGRENDHLRIISRWLEIGVSSAPKMIASFAFTDGYHVADSLVKGLAWWKEEIQEDLSDALRDGNWQAQAAAVYFLIAHGDKSFIPHILPFLHNEHRYVQTTAVHFLTEHGDKSLIPHIFPFLRNNNSDVQATVVKFLATYADKSLTPDILSLLRDRENNVRTSAVQLLTVYGDASFIPDILPLLHDEDNYMRQAAVQFLTAHGDKSLIPDILPFLQKTVNDPFSEVGQAVVEFLIAHGDKSLIPEVLPLIGEYSEYFRNTVAEFLIAHGDKSLIPEIFPLLRGDSEYVRNTVVKILIAHGDKSLIPDLLAILDDATSDPLGRVQSAVIELLTTHGDKSLIPDILPLINYANNDIAGKMQHAAVQFLTTHGDKSLIPDIFPLLRDDNKGARETAIEFLIVHGDPSFIDNILPLISDESEYARSLAVQFLTAHGNSQIITEILPLLRDGDRFVREKVLRFLTSHGDATLIPRILPSLADPDKEVREAAFDALMKLSGRALPPS